MLWQFKEAMGCKKLKGLDYKLNVFEGQSKVSQDVNDA